MVNNPPANAGVLSSVPGLGRSPGGGNGNSLLGFPSILLGKSHGQRNLSGFGPQGLKRVRYDLVTKTTTAY